MKYFVLLENPSNGARFAMVDSEKDADAVAMYETIELADEAAKRTLFGGHGYYEVYSTAMAL